MKIFTNLSLPAIFALSLTASADITSWRKDGNGLYPTAKAPLDWSATQNLWSTPLPDRSNACPIIIGERIFVTAEPAQLICLDKESGKILWERSNDYADVLALSDSVKKGLAEAKEKSEGNKDEIDALERKIYGLRRKIRRNPDDAELKKESDELKEQLAALKGVDQPEFQKFQHPPAHDTNGYSSYTPVSDGKHVFASFGIGVTVAYDLEGKLLWATRLDDPDHSWGGASSPILADNTLIVRFSDWVGLDPATGEEKWRVPTEITFNCPAIFELDGKKYLYTARGQLIRAADGKLLPSQNFTQTDKPWAFFNTPSVIGNKIYTVHGSEGAFGEAHALEIPTSASDLESKGLSLLWTVEVVKNRYYSSPLVHEDNVYLISRDYHVQALDTKTGKAHFEHKLKGMAGTAYPSLTLAGNLIFAGSEEGKTLFFKPGNTWQQVAETEASPYRSTPLFVGEICYLRTQEELRAIK